MLTILQRGRDLFVSRPGGLTAADRATLDDQLTYYERLSDQTGFQGYIQRKLYDDKDDVIHTLAGFRSRVCKALSAGGAGYEYQPDPYHRAETNPVFEPDWAGVLRLFPRYRAWQLECLARMSAADCGTIEASTGAGKCFQRGTEILLHNGTVKKVEDVVVGDQLMGPDSNPRVVISLARGREMMYRVKPTKGDPYVVNESHVLSLKGTPRRHGERSELLTITVRDYLRQSKKFKHCAKGWRSRVEFPTRAVPLDPYFLGVWLGDGSNKADSVMVTKSDREIADACEDVAAAHGLIVTVRTHSSGCPTYAIVNKPEHRGRGKLNPVLTLLRGLGVNDGTSRKHVPQSYKVNSREVRLQVLAGLLDTDGHMTRGGFDFISKYQQLANDTAFIARSLGLAAYVRPCEKGIASTGFRGTYYRVSITGDCSVIPTRIPRKKAPRRRQIKDVLVTGITVESVGEDDYYGFEVSGPDRLFLLGDFTVVHNSAVIFGLCGMYPRASVGIITRRLDVVQQLYDGAVKVLGPCVGLVQGGRYHLDRVTVCTADSAHKLPEDLDVLIFDEVHELAAPSYVQMMARFTRARTYGLTASLERDDGRHVEIEGACGPVLYRVSPNDAVAAGVTVPMMVEWVRADYPHDPIAGVGPGHVREQLGYWRNDVRNRMFADRCRQFAPDDALIVIVKMVEHACFLKRHLPNWTLCYGSSADADETVRAMITQGVIPEQDRMTPKRRRDIKSQFTAGQLSRVIATDVWSTGVDFPHLAAIVRADGGSSTTKTKQIAGRPCRTYEGKEYGLIVDGWDDFNPSALARSRKRRKVYAERGYRQIGPY